MLLDELDQAERDRFEQDREERFTYDRELFAAIYDDDTMEGESALAALAYME